MEIEYLEKYKYPTSAIFNITDDCNLACRYCFVQQEPHYMSLETGKKAILFLLNNYLIKKDNGWLFNNEKIHITFFGGEPTLLFDSIIIPLIEYIETLNEKDLFSFEMTTNGTLLNEERIKFLKKYNFDLLLSIDGDEYTQNYNRPCKNPINTSFNLISKNIQNILKYFPTITFRSTIYKDTVHLLYKNYLFAKKQGFLNYCAIPDVRSENWEESDLKILQEQINLICQDQILELQKNNNNYIKFSNLFTSIEKIFQNDFIITNMSADAVFEKKNNINRCGLGTMGISINYEGIIFSCQEQDSREFGKNFIIGDITHGINIESHKALLKEYFNAEIQCEKKDYCNQCFLFNICSKGCPSTSKDLFNNFGIIPFVRCYYDNIVLINAILAIKILEVNKLTIQF